MTLARAASSLGAAPVYVFFSVTLPLILPGVVSGALFAFATSFDEVVVALFIASLAQRTLPMETFSGVRQSITLPRRGTSSEEHTSEPQSLMRMSYADFCSLSITIQSPSTNYQSTHLCKSCPTHTTNLPSILP